MTKITGGENDYYLVQVKHPRREGQPAYQAECEDIIAALGLTFDEGCELKAIWRTAKARQGQGKPGKDPLDQAIYDAEKRVHYATKSLRSLQHERADQRGVKPTEITADEILKAIQEGKFEQLVVGVDMAKDGLTMVTGWMDEKGQFNIDKVSPEDFFKEPENPWIEHDGNKYPGNYNDVVEVRTRAGSVSKHEAKYYTWIWEHTQSRLAEIISYRRVG